MDVVSQGVHAVSDMSDHRGRFPGSSSNRQRGCSVAITEKAQKQGSAEADPVGKEEYDYSFP